MDLHPLVVHFPIAFLTVYALLELIRTKKLNDSSVWQYVKAFLVVIGSIGAVAALITGDRAAELGRPPENIVEWHSTFAYMSTIIFSIAAINYAIFALSGLSPKYLPIRTGDGWKKIERLRSAVFSGPVLALLAIAGLAAITITGALGGIMVYGPGGDPLTELIGKFLLGN